MGGNVEFGNESAQRINLKAIGRAQFSGALFSFMRFLNKRFEEICGFGLWCPDRKADAAQLSVYLSGSTRLAVDFSIGNEEFLSVKESMGDIDLMVNRDSESHLRVVLDSLKNSKTLGEVPNLISYKKTVGQFITLWKFPSLSQNVQVDFELAEFEDRLKFAPSSAERQDVILTPTEWSEFAHSSHWRDLRLGVKGVAHKYILRALCAPRLREMWVMKKNGNMRKLFASPTAISPYGMRTKYDIYVEPGVGPVMKDGLYVFTENKSRNFIRSVKSVFSEFFGQPADFRDYERMWSFVGILELVRDYFTQVDREAVLSGFIHTLWGRDAQALYRLDTYEGRSRDLVEKEMMIRVAFEILQTKVETIRLVEMVESYYER